MNKIAQTYVSTKGFVRRHKVGLTFTATSIAWITVMKGATNQHDEFLKEHGLYEEFYATLEDPKE